MKSAEHWFPNSIKAYKIMTAAHQSTLTINAELLLKITANRFQLYYVRSIIFSMTFMLREYLYLTVIWPVFDSREGRNRKQNVPPSLNMLVG